jgi:hypothetical protein
LGGLDVKNATADAIEFDSSDTKATLNNLDEEAVAELANWLENKEMDDRLYAVK